MTRTGKISRRRMLGQTLGAGAAGLTLTGCPKSDPIPVPVPKPTPKAEPKPSPNEQIGVGIIGCGRRNSQLEFPERGDRAELDGACEHLDS